MSVEPGRASSRAGWYRFTIRSQIRHICGLTLALLALLGTTPAGAATGIVAIGDFGVGGVWQRATGASVERFAERREADALITLGDNDYTESPPSFRANWLDSFGWAAADGLLVAGTLGNHDVRVRGGRYEFELLGMPGRYYRRELGQVELFLLDSNRHRRRPARVARSRSRLLHRALEGRRHAPSRLQLRRLPRRRPRPTPARPGLRAGAASTSCSPATITTTSASRDATA